VRLIVTLKNIIEKLEFRKVWEKYIEFYPDMGRLREKYSQIFIIFKAKNPVDNIEEMVIHIDRDDYEENNDYHEECFHIENNLENNKIEYRVHGKNNSIEWTGFWDLSASKWEEWLGFYIHDKVLVSLSHEQIVALCLYEMT